MGMTARQVLKVSRLINKMGLEIKDPKADVEEMGVDLIMQIANKVGDAEQEVSELISVVLGVPEEEALDIDLYEAFNEKFKDGEGNEIISFFVSAVKSRMQESSNS